MDESYIVTWQSREAVESKWTRFLWSGALSWQKIHEYSRSIEAWKVEIEWFTKCHEYRDLDGIDGEPFELEWEMFAGHATLQLLREIQMTMEVNRIQPEQFEDRIIFMSMCNDIDWREQDTMKFECRILQVLQRTPKYFWKDIGHSSDQELKKKWYGTHTYKPNGLWNNAAEMMKMINLGESGHSIFRGTSALARGSLKSKGCGKTWIHHNGDSTTA